jgi:hypothetical protein
MALIGREPFFPVRMSGQFLAEHRPMNPVNTATTLTMGPDMPGVARNCAAAREAEPVARTVDPNR